MVSASTIKVLPPANGKNYGELENQLQTLINVAIAYQEINLQLPQYF